MDQKPWFRSYHPDLATRSGRGPFATHPAVAGAGVAGMSDEREGEMVKPWIVTHEGHQVTTEEIRVRCRERLTTYKVPRQVEFCTSLPKTLIGKLLRHELVE